MKVQEEYLRDLRERAEKALAKKAPLGPDIDLSQFYLCSPRERVEDVREIEDQLKEAALYAGVGLKERRPLRTSRWTAQRCTNGCSGRFRGSLRL